MTHLTIPCRAGALLAAVLAAGPAVAPTPKLTTRRVFVAAIRSADDFEAFSRELGGERFTKFVIDLRTDEVRYFDVNVYRIHTEFVFAEIYKKPITMEALKAFNRNYEI